MNSSRIQMDETLLGLKCKSEKLETSGGPLVVVDRNILTYCRPEKILPEGAEIVLPDAFFHEMSESSRNEELPKFVSWLRRHASTVWFAIDWRDILPVEKSSSFLVSPLEIISILWTNELRDHARDGEFMWPDNTKDEYYENCRKEFIERARTWTKYVADNDIDMSEHDNDADSLREFLRDPTPIKTFLQKWESHWFKKPWSLLIGEFPDQPAICKWWRIINYYSIMHSLGQTKSFENNFEDAQYAFAASYVGRLATDDKRLIDMMGHIFPDVTIFTSNKKKSINDSP